MVLKGEKKGGISQNRPFGQGEGICQRESK